MRIAYADFTGALSAAGCRQVGRDNWTCPSHEDRNASLSVKAENGGDETLFHCHAGCDHRDITGALELRADAPKRDGLEFDPGPPTPRQTPSWASHDYNAKRREYAYCDENGTLLYTVVRQPGKRFSQQGADGAHTIKGIRRVLYRLPAVLSAVADGQAIHVVEGEKDTDALRLEGHTATCNSGGAKGWKDELADSLKGASMVVIWQDKDEPGREWARQVAASLDARETPYQVVKARTGKDAYDHLAAGYTAAEALSARPDASPAVPAQRDAPSTVADGYGPDGKPAINVTRQVDAAEWLRNEIGQGQLSCLFQREDGLTHTPRIGEDGYLPLKPDARQYSPAQVRRINPEQVKALIEYRYHVYKLVSKEGSGDEGKGKPKERQQTFFPGQAVATVINSAALGEGAPNLRRLAGVTHTQVMRADGSILATPGYDDASGLLFLPEEGDTVTPVPDSPTPEQVRAAVKLVLTPVAEYSFASDHHKANWLGLMMTPVLRQLLPPPYQMGVFTASTRGSGKTMLADLIMIVHGGETKAQPEADTSKLRAEILATLTTTTAPVILFDNIRGKLSSPVLEMLLTGRTFSGRKLGETLDIQANNDRLWLATSNNATIGGDLDRRVRIVRINPLAERPEDHPFKLNPKGWMREHRGEYLAALLTIARGWVAAGKPMETGVRSDDYKDWVESLRGMLQWAGVPGLFAGEDVSDDVVDEDADEWARFLEEAHRVFGGAQFTVADLLGKAARTVSPKAGEDPWGAGGNEFDQTCLPAEFIHTHGRDISSASAKVSLAKFFGYRLETVRDGLSLECAFKSRKSPNRYQIKSSRA